MRRDAEANRERLIEAGRMLLREHGGDLPVERFCESAGVNRATFYRHFPDRQALYSSICDHEIALMARAVEDTEEPLAFLTLLAEMLMVYDRFVLSLADLPEFAGAPENDLKVRNAIAGPLARAKAGGWICNHITEDDIYVIARMVGCGWRLDHQASCDAAMKRRLQLILNGLKPEPSQSHPLTS